MSDDKLIDLSGRRSVRYGTDPAGLLTEALACARENGVTGIAIAMVDGAGEDFYLVSLETVSPALLGAIEICKDIVLDAVREE